jgi:hypothetical protein
MPPHYRLLGLSILLLFTCPPALGQGSVDWQQEVSYEMDVTVHPSRHRILGRQTLHYINHSPDTLHHAFYHLYFNAFQPHSMMAERNRELPDPDARIVPRIFDLGPDEVGFHHIDTLTQNGISAEFSIFDTVMKVELAEPIPPGGEAVFEMSFRSQIPLQTRRSGRDNLEGIDYSMSQWYPKMAAYDRRGWHADPYVGREFYAPFGTFDVRITLPAEYVIGATGVLQNPEDVGHGYGSAASAQEGDSLTWHFSAENVHDFAWAADPDYLHDVLETEEGTIIHLLYQPDVAEAWRSLHNAVPEMMTFLGREYGRYLYPQMTVAQAGDGGMEYPMITFITGRRPPASLLGVTAHEIAHMWYYGMLGSNEADFAWMDEGFVSYATTELMAHLQGNPNPSHIGAFLNVLQARHLGLFERLNTPSDWFQTNFGYSIASYAGGEMLLDMLGYVISDSLRDRFLDVYYERFALRHPQPDDVEKVAEDVSGLRLDWYFEQFGDSILELDYALAGLRSTRENGGWRTVLTLKRRAPAVMPVDVRLTLENGSVQWVNVPLGIMQGSKPVASDWIVADPWPWTSPEYALELMLPDRVADAEIDPLLQTLESTRINNTLGLPVTTAFLEPPGQSWSRYRVGWRPLLQVAHGWGYGGGLQFRGAYLFNQHAARATLKLWPEVLFSNGQQPDVWTIEQQAAAGRAVDGIDYDLFVSNTTAAGGLLDWTLRSRRHLGILQSDAQVSLLVDPTDLLSGRQHRVTLGLRHQHRTTDRALSNRMTEGFVPQGILSAHARASISGPLFRHVLAGETGGTLGGSGEAWTANRVWMDVAWGMALGRFTGTFRLMAGIGDERLARHKRFQLGTAPFEERWGDAAYRSIGAIFEDAREEVHWTAFSGPGPVAYLQHEASAAGAAGPHLAALSARMLTPGLGGGTLLGPLRAEAFVGAGETWSGLWLSDFKPDDFVVDAGVGVRYELEGLSGLDRWLDQSDVLSNLTLTARFPLWVSHPSETDRSGKLAFRWLVGVQIDELPWH